MGQVVFVDRAIWLNAGQRKNKSIKEGHYLNIPNSEAIPLVLQAGDRFCIEAFDPHSNAPTFLIDEMNRQCGIVRSIKKVNKYMIHFEDGMVQPVPCPLDFEPIDGGWRMGGRYGDQIIKVWRINQQAEAKSLQND